MSYDEAMKDFKRMTGLVELIKIRETLERIADSLEFIADTLDDMPKHTWSHRTE